MTGSDWRATLARGSGSDVSPDEFATLAECDISYVHIDERGRNITMACEAASSPNMSVEFYVVFNETREVRAAGWSHEVPTRFTLRQDPDTTCLVSIAGPGTELTFRCAAVVLGSVREVAAGPE